ncbi:hypothetical protein F1654_08795 [Alkalicaulis satelles]|uniref:Uncharacterized protein n=1 Tax=Alkalicaulis satelles TaxID=2609175 RepID=A0A5M6ZJG4_9PROT|nr:hypothetical protein [Alkalicaulis satelles]KAA5803884.1 hypothetical protein F1654_08795 [Alkalicaulis satelles]
MTIEEFKYMLPCPICGGQFQCGPHRYEGHTLDVYRVHVCGGCELGNHDGWGREHEAKLIALCERNGESIPERLPNGLLPFNPPRRRG